MASGKIVGAVQQNIYIFIQWSSVANRTGNYSDVTAKLYLYTTGNVYSSAQKNYTLTVGGQSRTGTYKIGNVGKGDHLICTHSFRVNHSADGSCKCIFSASFGVRIKYSDVFVDTLSVSSQSYNLDKINRNIPSINAFDLTGITSNSFKIRAASSHEYGVQNHYSVNQGAWNAINSEAVVTGLKANTNYSVQLRATAGNGLTRYITKSVKTDIIPVNRIELKNSISEMVEEDEYRLTADVNADASNKTLLYSSSDTAVAVISNTGVIRAVKAGIATITVRAADGRGKYVSFKITVKSLITEIRTPSETVYIRTGKTFKLDYEVLPENARDKSVIFSKTRVSGDGEITISKDGAITAEGNGEWQITIISNASKNVTHTINCVVLDQAVWTDVVMPEYIDYFTVKSINDNLHYIAENCTEYTGTVGLEEIAVEQGYGTPINGVLKILNTIESNIDKLNAEFNIGYNPYYEKKYSYDKYSVLSSANVRRWIDFSQFAFMLLNDLTATIKKLYDNKNRRLLDCNGEKIFIGVDNNVTE